MKCEKGVPTGDARGFRHLGYCFIPFQHPSKQVNQPKVLVDNDVSTTTNISVTRMSKRMKGKLGKYREREAQHMDGDVQQLETWEFCWKPQYSAASRGHIWSHFRFPHCVVLFYYIISYIISNHIPYIISYTIPYRIIYSG